jgi:DNA-nicking Smr family endonuclease
MKELDLHGLYHHQVRDEVENFVLLNAKELPVRIIIGGSNRMRNLTENILIKHKFDYHIPAHNPGEIIVTFDKEYKL